MHHVPSTPAVGRQPPRCTTSVRPFIFFFLFVIVTVEASYGRWPTETGLASPLLMWPRKKSTRKLRQAEENHLSLPLSLRPVLQRERSVWDAEVRLFQPVWDDTGCDVWSDIEKSRACMKSCSVTSDKRHELCQAAWRSRNQGIKCRSDCDYFHCIHFKSKVILQLPLYYIREVAWVILVAAIPQMCGVMRGGEIERMDKRRMPPKWLQQAQWVDLRGNKNKMQMSRELQPEMWQLLVGTKL